MDLIHALYITIKKNDIKYISQILSNVIKNWSKDFTECTKNKKFFRYCETKKIIEDFFIEIFNSTDIKQSNTHNISLTDAIMQYSVQHNKPFNKSIFIDLPKKKLQNINTNNDKLRQHLTKLTNSNKKDNTKELIEQEIESTFQEMNKKFNYDKISSLEKKLSKEQKDLIEAIKLANKQIESKNNLNVLENVFLNTHPDTELIAPKNNFDENKILEKDLTEYIKRVNVDEKYDVGNAFTRKINTDKRRNYRIVTTIENYLNQVLPQYEKLTLRDQSQNKAYVENEIEYRVEQLYKKKQEDSKNYKPLLALESEKKQDKANDSRFGS